MADQLYLSYWLPEFSEANMAAQYERMLRLFPYSKLAKAPATVRVFAIEYAEPPVMENALEHPPDLAEVVRICRDFAREDCACRLETWWDLWQYDTDWKVGPARVALTCFGPEFDREAGEDLQIDFGLDAYFLPSEEEPDQLVMVESNLKSLLKLVKDLDAKFAEGRRKLWTESGENLAERLKSLL